MSIRLRYLKLKEYINSYTNIFYWRNLKGRFQRWNRRRLAYKQIPQKDLQIYNLSQNIKPPYRHRKYR